MTYNVFGGTSNLAHSLTHFWCAGTCLEYLGKFVCRGDLVKVKVTEAKKHAIFAVCEWSAIV